MNLSSGNQGPFAILPSGFPPLTPGIIAQVVVRYTPRTLRTHSDTIVITSNDPMRPRVEIPLAGVGVDPEIVVHKSTPPTMPASPIDFGTVYRQARSSEIILYVQNNGVGPLFLQGVQYSAGSSSDFVLSGTPLPATLLPGTSSIALTLEYAPSAVGSDSAAIELYTNDRDQPVTTVTLLGEGVGCAPNTWDIDGDPNNACEYSCVQASPPVEICNGGDDNCDGAIDEGFDIGVSCDGLGLCGAGVIECANGDPSRSTCSTNPGQSQDESTVEICNYQDDDCDTGIDNGFDLNIDVVNCGACNNVCTATQAITACSGGNCEIDSCLGSFRDCNTVYADGCEVDVLTSTTHCNACGRNCIVANGVPACNVGQCEISSCNTGYNDCNQNYQDGCEANLNTDVTTCGDCNTVCTVANGIPECDSGNCAIAGCVAPWGDCNGGYADGCEINTNTSLTHCGGCNSPCTVANGTPLCSNGSCIVGSCNPDLRTVTVTRATAAK